MNNKTNQDIFNNIRSKEINLKDYYDVIKNRFWVIAIIVILATSAGYFYNRFNNNYVPMYQSSTRMIIDTDSEFMKTLMVMIKDPIVMEKVKDSLLLNKSTESLASQIVVSKVENSAVVDISVTDKDPAMAATIANETAKIAKDQMLSILNFKNVQLLAAAIEKPVPVNHPQNTFLKISFPIGLIIGIGLVFLMDSLDETIKREREIEEYLGVPVIGVVSNMNKKKLLREKKKYKTLELKGEKIDA